MNNNKFNLQEEDIFKLLNYVEIDEEEFNIEDEKISDIQKKRIIKNLNKEINPHKKIKILKYGALAAAITLICCFGNFSIPTVSAKDIPILNSIIQTLNDKFGSTGEYSNFSQLVNKSITDNNVTITINEALADDSRMIIGYTIKSKKELKDLQVFGLSKYLLLNGKSPNGTHGSSMGEYKDKYTYICSEEIKTDIPNSSKFNVDLKINDILGKKGSWNFAFSISKKDLMDKSTVFRPNYKIDLEDSIINVDKVVFSPIDTSIFIDGKYKNSNNINHKLLKYDYWLAFDDKGNEIMPSAGGTGGGNSNKTGFKCTMNYEPLKYTPKYLTIIPCNITPSVEGSVDSNGNLTRKEHLVKELYKPINSPLPMKFSQGKFGDVIIKDIIKENDKTTLKVIAKGISPYIQATSIHIKDTAGNDVSYKNYNIKRNPNNLNEFTIDFEKLDSSKKYNLVISSLDNIEIRNDLKFNINLK
ncbi:DUF4179 domain-containing protein [Clostridium niameyense]|uniref:DUF4179 domain-containing protein n=1 Tax=Clostridium niameyense TaxID=1622073 RepID=A0A6M0RBC6_9CLOT|nr:DUF4179 domain-containing protein [Clostridium niameyense]NEZ47472.1 DUF4179 domain-containing protein [Clostridium niameyense]